GVICMAGALLLGALPTAAAEGQGFLRQLSGILLLVYGVSLVTGGLRGHSDPLLPLKEEVPRQFGSGLSVLRADSTVSLEAALRQAADVGLPSLVDVYADWCVQCKLFEQHVLSEPRVLKRLASVAVIRLDVSAGTSDQHQLLQRYQLFGPPSLLFFDQAGQELPALRTQGSISAERLLHDLNQITPGKARGSN
ncbi:MAG: thioredoxin family protein, partial [Kistimonas sp.]|nr:thioredoxin family protein [Kistimonas sp.]